MCIDENRIVRGIFKVCRYGYNGGWSIGWRLKLVTYDRSAAEALMHEILSDPTSESVELCGLVIGDRDGYRGSYWRPIKCLDQVST